MALTVLRDRNARILMAGHSAMPVVLAIWMIDLIQSNAAAGLISMLLAVASSSRAPESTPV